MRIAILGSTGYVGSLLAHRLLADKHFPNKPELVCVHRKTSSLTRLDDIRASVTLLPSDDDSLKACFGDGVPFDAVVNTACSYLRGASNEQVMESNLLFPLRVLNRVADCGQTQVLRTRFVSIGTGLPDAFNLYTYAKKQLNDMGRYLAGLGHVQFVNLELENYYGPGEPADRFLPRSMKTLAAGEPLLLTSGDQHRDFVHIDDVLDALLLTLTHPCLPSYFNLPIGSGQAPSIREFVSYVAQCMQSTSDLRFGAVTARQNEPSCRADLSAYTMMGGTVRWPWRQGIRSLLQQEGYLQ